MKIKDKFIKFKEREIPIVKIVGPLKTSFHHFEEGTSPPVGTGVTPIIYYSERDKTIKGSWAGKGAKLSSLDFSSEMGKNLKYPSSIKIHLKREANPVIKAKNKLCDKGLITWIKNV